MVEKQQYIIAKENATQSIKQELDQAREVVVGLKQQVSECHNKLRDLQEEVSNLQGEFPCYSIANS